MTEKTYYKYIDRNEAIKIFRSVLKEKTGKPWSVKGGRGTAWGWISIGAPPRRKICHEPNPKFDDFAPSHTQSEKMYIEVDPEEGKKGHYTSESEMRELAAAFGMDYNSHFHCQGISISPDETEYWVNRLLGSLKQCTHCKNAWIPLDSDYCSDDCKYWATRPEKPEPVKVDSDFENRETELNTRNENGKFPAVKFEIVSSEWGDCEGLVFYSWEAIHEQIQNIARDHAHVYGVKERSCYDKTNFVVTFGDGTTHPGRLDIHGHMESGDRDLGQHIWEFYAFASGEYRPAWMNAQQWSQAQAQNAQYKEQATSFLENYELVRGLPLEDFEAHPEPAPQPEPEPAAPVEPQAESFIGPAEFSVTARHDRNWTWIKFEGESGRFVASTSGRPIRKAIKDAWGAQFAGKRKEWYIKRIVSGAEVLEVIREARTTKPKENGITVFDQEQAKPVEVSPSQKMLLNNLFGNLAAS